MMMIKLVRNCLGRDARLPAAFGAATAIWLMTATPAAAQTPNLQGSGVLVRQDFSDCDNSNVTNPGPDQAGGSIEIIQTPAGATTANVEIFRGTPNTAYTLYWKCHNALGTIQTDGSGEGQGSFQFQAAVGHLLSFDMYPAGAPLGNKFQSTSISPTFVGVGPMVRQDFSDCGNNDVMASDPTRLGGSLIVLQRANGTTMVNAQISGGTPNTAYTLYWKCQRALGTVQTNGSGSGSGSFELQTTPGQVLTFDMYPDGAPAGNKFQSVRITPAPEGGAAAPRR
jgi:hypothetical protein